MWFFLWHLIPCIFYEISMQLTRYIGFYMWYQRSLVWLSQILDGIKYVLLLPGAKRPRREMIPHLQFIYKALMFKKTQCFWKKFFWQHFIVSGLLLPWLRHCSYSPTSQAISRNFQRYPICGMLHYDRKLIYGSLWQNFVRRSHNYAFNTHF